MIYRKLQIKYGVDLPASTKIGPGFKIEHLNGIVVNPDVVIGKNCNIYNGVTIGKEKRGIREGCPTIADEVWIGANAIVVGRIQIGLSFGRIAILEPLIAFSIISILSIKSMENKGRTIKILAGIFLALTIAVVVLFYALPDSTTSVFLAKILPRR